jgi:7,8-dihydropterin-6-yl-methyl-4-(beta-D-ribofuranosyl)aminobenzene 5'-phosphate synthase
MNPRTNLTPIDRVEITTIVDNMLDVLLPSSESVKRYVLKEDFFESEQLVAEHGFAALVTLHAGDRSETFLFDAGLSRTGLMHNMDVLEIRPDQLRCIVLSHGHADHSNGLMGLAQRMGGRRVPLLLHPDAMAQRRFQLPDGRHINLPPPERESLAREGIEIVAERKPTLLLDGMAMITGQIERTTEFEKGLGAHFALIDGSWKPDPLVHDDQALIVNLKDRGLVVLTGCGHAGVINTVRHAQKEAGNTKVCAVIGGFHLSGPVFEQIIPPTVAAFHELQPELLVPAHCTGWKAIHQIAREFPDAFVQNSVGTRFVLDAKQAAA